MTLHPSLLLHCGLCLLLPCAPASGATLIFGDSVYHLATTEGSFTASFLANNTNTGQMQIAASDLVAQGLQAGNLLTGVRARLNGITTMIGDRTSSDFEITLAQAAFDLANMSTTFATNMIDPVLVRDGPLTIYDELMPESGVPRAFGQLISFDTPYTYQGGDLIFMFRKRGFSDFTSVDGETTDSSIVRNLNSSGFGATSGNFQTSFPVLQFELTSSAPEPSRALLLLAGTLGVALRRRRRDF